MMLIGDHPYLACSLFFFLGLAVGFAAACVFAVAAEGAGIGQDGDEVTGIGA